MRKLLVAAFIAVAFISSAFASPAKEVNYFVLSSFKAQFQGAENVQWTIAPSYAKATFVLNDVRTEAFYELDGNFIGTCHNIGLHELPVFAKRNFAKKYGNYTVKEAIQFDGIYETAYFISAENEKHAIVLKVDARNISIHSLNNKN